MSARFQKQQTSGIATENLHASESSSKAVKVAFLRLNAYFDCFRGQRKNDSSNRKILVAIAHTFEDDILNEQMDIAFHLLETRSMLQIVKAEELPGGNICYKLRVSSIYDRPESNACMSCIATVGESGLISQFEITQTHALVQPHDLRPSREC